jgi:hypothetical protein
MIVGKCRQALIFLRGGNVRRRDSLRVRGSDILATKTRDTEGKPPRRSTRLRTSMAHLATTSAGRREVGEINGMTTEKESASIETKTDEYGSDAGKLEEPELELITVIP